MDETIDYEIDDDEVRRLGLTPTGDFEVIQRIELPDAPIHVTNHRLTVYRTADGERYLPEAPELKGPIFGPRLLAMIGWLKSVGHCSYSTLEAIPRQQQLGSDETSLKDNGKKHWIWCITAAMFSGFHIARSRAREVLEELVGTEFAGYLNVDYFSANCSFAWNFDIKAPYCWAHLIRDIRFLLKHPNGKTESGNPKGLNFFPGDQ